MSDHGNHVSQNLRVTFETLAEHSPEGAYTQFGPIKAVSAGVPTPTFNRVFVFDQFEKPELMAAIDWFTTREDPFWVTGVRSLEEDIETALSDRSYEKSENRQPGMALSLSSDLPAPETDADMEPVTNESELDEWATVAESVFDFAPETTRLITPETVLSDDSLRLLLGRVDGEPAACGILSLHDGVAGLYLIGVEEDFRRRGIGEAMTWEVLRVGKEQDAEIGVLQSTQMGYPLYEQMGFETEIEFRFFALDD